MTLHVWCDVGGLTLLDLSTSSGVTTRLVTQLRSLKTVMFNMNLLSLLLYSPKLLEKSLFYFGGNFVCGQCVSKSCSILLQSFSLLGVTSNVGYDFLGRRNLWVLYTKRLLSLPSGFLRTLLLPPEQVCIQGRWLCCRRPGWALADRICSVVLCCCSVPWILSYVWPLPSMGCLGIVQPEFDISGLCTYWVVLNSVVVVVVMVL